MAIIFMDIDGVLNTRQSRSIGGNAFIPSHVRNLANLVQATNSRIVISSDWRFGGIGSQSQMQLSLVQAAPEVFGYLVSRIVGATANTNDSREDQILQWMADNAPKVDKFIAIDDNNFLFPTMPKWLVLTDQDIGFDTYAYQYALNKLM